MAESEHLVRYEVADHVAVLTLNRPERNNGWTVPMEQQYFAALRRAEQEPNVRAVVVTGAGRSFCPGMDTQVLAASAEGSPTQPHLRTPMTTPRSLRIPIIAAINGACAGIGLVVALNCDLRFAASDAKITTSFAHRGIMAEHGMAWMLPRIIGSSRALDLLLSARVVTGEHALEIGLVDRAWAKDELLPQTMDYALNLTRLSSPLAMGLMKEQVYRGLESTLEQSRQLALSYWASFVAAHPDHREGVRSYLERRDPDFFPWDPGTPRDPGPLP